MTSDLLEENADLRKQVEELKDEIATRNGKLAILISENERLKGIVLGNEEEISDLKKSCDETQELLDKQIEATYKLYKENAELKEQQFSLRNERNTFLAQNEQYEQDLIDFNDKLANAKEIIREFMKYEINEYDGSLEIHFEELKKQAEQFIKDSEVEK